MESGADIEVQGGELGTYSPLMLASARGFEDVVRWLIVGGANVNAQSYEDGKTALDWAIDGKHYEVQKILRKHGGKTKAELKKLDGT